MDNTASEALLAPNTVVVEFIHGSDCLEMTVGGMEEVFHYKVLAAKIDEDKDVLNYDLLPVPLHIGGVYTQAINAAVAHLPRTRSRRASEMGVLSDTELAELRARGVSVQVKFPKD